MCKKQDWFVKTRVLENNAIWKGLLASQQIFLLPSSVLLLTLRSLNANGINDLVLVCKGGGRQLCRGCPAGKIASKARSCTGGHTLETEALLGERLFRH